MLIPVQGIAGTSLVSNLAGLRVSMCLMRRHKKKTLAPGKFDELSTRLDALTREARASGKEWVDYAFRQTLFPGLILTGFLPAGWSWPQPGILAVKEEVCLTPVFFCIVHDKLTELNSMKFIMQTVNIHEAKTQLSRLIEQAVKGDSFIIAKAGKPLVKVIRLDAPSAGQIRRPGFMAGQITVPDDFDNMGAKEIELLFGD